MSHISPVIPSQSDNAHTVCRRLLRVEKYLARQVKAAHNLGLPVLERYYLVGYFALELWLMEQIEPAAQGGQPWQNSH